MTSVDISVYLVNKILIFKCDWKGFVLEGEVDIKFLDTLFNELLDKLLKFLRDLIFYGLGYPD
jgi:hypothetical protein